MHFRNIGWYPDMTMNTKATHNYTKSICSICMTQNAMAYHYICHTGICAYHMLLIRGREEIAMYYPCASMPWEESELLV